MEFCLNLETPVRYSLQSTEEAPLESVMVLSSRYYEVSTPIWSPSGIAQDSRHCGQCAI